MVQVRTYRLPPTALIPNSHLPLIHYPGLLSPSECKAAAMHDKFTKNGWQTQWIFRYGSTQKSHYHSKAHECMTVLSGSATIRFGVADTVDDLDESTYGSGHEQGGIELEARTGDVFVLPAGVAHKTHDATPTEEFKLLTPGDGNIIAAENPRKALDEIELSGFTMIGAYPKGSSWDFACGTSDQTQFQRSWDVPVPEMDPVLGLAQEGLCGLWKK